jgi:transposase
LKAVVAKLLLRVRALEAQLAQNSSNSSRPPSTDPPGAAPAAKPATKPGRRRGGQPGHKQHQRVLLPPERVKETTSLRPTGCRRCAKPLLGSDPEPYQHQVVEIPRLLAQGHDYWLHSLFCKTCKIYTRAELPVGVPTGNFGPRLQAMIAVCSGQYHMSKRMIEEMMSDFFDAKLCLGSVSNLEQDTSEALAAPVAEAAEYVKEQPVKHADETGWTEAKKRAWLWVVVTSNVAVFLIRRSRGAVVAKELLGAVFTGILNSDRWSAYNWVPTSMRQLCWAHLVRHFKGFEDHGVHAKRIGLSLQDCADRMFRHWHRVRDGTLQRSSFQQYMRPIRSEILELLREGSLCGVPKVAGCCREILKLQAALFTFVRVEGVEPTNNTAEQAVRRPVLWRKGCFGTDSEKGSRFVERILTVVATLRMQKRNVLDYVTLACEARLRRQDAPSLLPQTLVTELRAAAA